MLTDFFLPASQTAINYYLDSIEEIKFVPGPRDQIWIGSVFISSNNLFTSLACGTGREF